MATSNRDRINKAMDLLRDGLCPFVIQEMRGAEGHGWWGQYQQANPGLRAASPNELDVQALLKLMRDRWRDVFSRALGKFEQNLVHELLEARNEWAHQAAFSTDDTERALDSVGRLLQAVSAQAQATEVEKERQLLRRQQYEEFARREEKRATTATIATAATSGLRPWREIITPHEDVQKGIFQQAEFAADLGQVHRGEGMAEYANPVEFFRRTYLTEGLKSLLKNALLRLGGKGGDPVIELQTNFGGGKTHSMLALYHLASDADPEDFPGLEPILREVRAAGLEDIPYPHRAVIVGTALGPNEPRRKDDGTVINTIWGELAWQIGRRKGFALVAESDASGVNPGADVLAALFDEFAPSLILIDEWVAFVRQLYGVDGLKAGSFDANLSFAQSLTEAVRQSPDTLLVASLPASDIEIGGTAGREALDRLRNTFGRMQASWRPATTEEGFEIVRRRLFEPITDQAGYAARDAVIRAFVDLYRQEGGQFPSRAKDGNYRSQMEAAYPFHPELFHQLYGAWSTLDKFQRTRGVLRLMASVIHTLWSRQDGSLLIMPASIPMDAPPVIEELTRYLDDPWRPVIERDVDGAHSLPLQLDSENPNFGRLSAVRRVARTIYLGSAPTFNTANRGIEDRDIKLGCAQPGESVPVFGDALRALTDRATHLYADHGRYWFSTQPSVTRTALERAQAMAQDAVYDEIARRLRDQQGSRGDFVSVHPCPTTSADVRDEPAARLVILDPQRFHTRGSDDSPAIRAATAILNHRGESPRHNRNCVVFAAADRTKLVDLEQATRQYLAWKEIYDQRETMNLDAFQERQAKSRRDAEDEAVNRRIAETYFWVLAPRQELHGPVEWEEFRAQGEGAIPVRVSQRLKTEGLLITQYGPTLLRGQMDRVPLWRGDHVTLKQLADDFAQYLYLPRLKNSQVLVEAVAEGAAMLTWQTDTFAHAEQWDEASGRYLGLTAGSRRTPVLNDTTVVVRREVALRQLEEDQRKAEDAARDAAGATPGKAEEGSEPGTIGTGDGHPGWTAGPTPDGNGATPAPKRQTTKRFYGQVRLDPSAMSTQSGKIAEAVVQHLASLLNADVSVTLEISASVPNGIPEDVRRIVNENSRTLRFTQLGFEEE